jgi:hypothetical protein
MVFALGPTLQALLSRGDVFGRRMCAGQCRVGEVVPVPGMYRQVPAQGVTRPECDGEAVPEVVVDLERAGEPVQVVPAGLERLGQAEQAVQGEIGVSGRGECRHQVVGVQRAMRVQQVQPFQRHHRPLRLPEPKPR